MIHLQFGNVNFLGQSRFDEKNHRKFISYPNEDFGDEFHK